MVVAQAELVRKQKHLERARAMCAAYNRNIPGTPGACASVPLKGKVRRIRRMKMIRIRLCRLAIAAEVALNRRAPLGPLEMKVLEFVWTQECELTVRDVQAAFPDLAYTTLMTTLDRLFQKRFLTRRLRGRAFAYAGRRSPGDALGELISGQVTDLLTDPKASSAILSTLVRAVASKDVALLDELDELVQAEAARLRGESK